MKVLLTAGTWNNELNNSGLYGKESHLIEKMYKLLLKEKDFEIDFYNGGKYEDLEKLVDKAGDYEIIFWMANVPNELPKVRDVKKTNPLALVVGSKRNHYDEKNGKQEYTFVDILNKSLLQRNNLTIEFARLKDKTKFKMLLFDPLGTSWYDGYDLDALVENLLSRLRFILTTRRERTFGINRKVNIPSNEEFFSYVREVAEIFHKTIEHSSGVTRLLGNASFRYKNKVYVSERDVDKSFIDKSKFVNVFLKENKVYYYGTKKPSKDAVVQIRLYNLLPKINYIVHSHCYIEDGYFTNTPVPCGALDEIDEVLEVMKKYYDNNYSKDEYKINLKGHGCLILSSNLDNLKRIKYQTRHLPEKLTTNKKRNIVITAGGTSEAIDSVRKITNSSSGKLGSVIADKFKDDNIFYICTKKSVRPSNKNIKFIEIENTKDLAEAVKDVLTNNKIDIFIHSMAVSDYMVDYVTTSTLLSQNYHNENLQEYLLNNKNILKDEKISSYEDDLIIRMIKTPKVISIIKELSKDTVLIGFKLLNNVEESELISVAKKLRDKNNCDYVIANDLKNINEKSHIAYILDRQDEIIRVNTKEEIACKIYDLLKFAC